MAAWSNYKDTPLTPEELQRVRLALDRTEAAQPILGPAVAAVTSWRAWLFAVAFVVWINRPDILAALQTLVGGG